MRWTGALGSALLILGSPVFGYGGYNPSGQASVQDVMGAINRAIKSEARKNPKYKDYSVKTVSWDDVSRYNDDDHGGLSAFGDNICDTTLHARDGSRLYTVRSDNWNEKLGTVRTRDIRLVEGNQRSSTLNEITLRAGSFYIP